MEIPIIFRIFACCLKTSQSHEDNKDQDEGGRVWLACICGAQRHRGADADDYQEFLKEAHESAARLYTSLIRCDLLVGEQTLVRGCRMSHDPQLYYNPDAHPLPVVREAADPLQPYEGTKTDDNGTVVWYPDFEDLERIDLEFQTCLSKAIDECEGQAEHCLQLLADYCAMAHLSEEGCVGVRTYLSTIPSTNFLPDGSSGTQYQS